MSGDAELEFRWHSLRKGGQGLVVVSQSGSVFTDKLEITKEADRSAVADKVVERFPGLDRVEVIEQLEQLACESVGDDDHHDQSEGQADLLIALTDVEGVELFHSPDEGLPLAYALIDMDDHVETWAVKSSGFREWLRAEFFKKYRKAPNNQAIDTAVSTIEAMARLEGDALAVALRVGMHDGAIWIDLCDEQWRAVRIDKTGYTLVESRDLEVRFRRAGGMKALPPPEARGTIDEFRPLVNIESDLEWARLVGWLVCSLHPSIDLPILLVSGQEGSAKTTICSLVRRLIDPNYSPLRHRVKDEHDLIITSQNSWVLAFDNMSTLSQELSDGLCCMSTGTAFSCRTLFTTDEETLFAAKRPVMVNGIANLATRGDFASRVLHLTLKAISPESRLTKEEVEQRFVAAQPRILGALFDAVSCALRRVDGLEVPRLQRMADACLWVTAAEPALGLKDGEFIQSLESQTGESVDAIIDSSAIGPVLVEFLDDRGGTWSGIAMGLLAELERQLGDRRRPAGWPKSPQVLANEIRRLAVSLRQKGIEVEEPARNANPRTYKITRKSDRGSSCGEPRAGAGETPSPGAKKGESRGSAPSALHSQTPEDGGGLPEQNEMGSDLDGHWEGH